MPSVDPISAPQAIPTTDSDAPSDEQLALEVARHLNRADREAAGEEFMKLYDRHRRLLWAFVAARSSRRDADDIAQEIWQRVWGSLPSRFKGGNFRAWLYAIARNYLVDSRRRSKNVPPAAGELAEHSDPAGAAARKSVDEAEEAEALAQCLEKLRRANGDAARVVVARLAGESYSDICKRSGLAEDRAYTLFHEAKRLLIGCIEKTFV